MTLPNHHNLCSKLFRRAATTDGDKLLSLMRKVRADRQMTFLMCVSAEQTAKHPDRPLTEAQVMRGIFNAVENSGIDLSDATSECEMTATIMAYLAAGHRALHPAGGDA